MIRTIVEVLLIVAVGGAVGLAYNATSPEGINLERNYLLVDVPVTPPKKDKPTKSKPPKVGPASGEPMNGGGELGNGPSEPIDPPEPVEDEFSETVGGMLNIAVDEVELYQSIQADGDESIVILDARSQDHFNEEHIPGSKSLNFYQADKLIDELLPSLQEASMIIVYCNGGDCEDSIRLGAYLLNDHGIPYDAIRIFEGGIADWKKAGLSVVKAGE